jgi:hypothetical protein
MFEMTNWTIACNLFSFDEFVADGMTQVAARARFGRLSGTFPGLDGRRAARNKDL